MPEYPEMENYRLLLGERISGQQILGVDITRDKSINMSAEQFQSRLIGKHIWFVERRGKHLLFHLDNGERLLLHLMLGGWMFFGSDEERPDRTVQVTIKLTGGNLYFIGLRLGYLHLISVKEVDAKLSELGPEPFDKHLKPEKFVSRFKGKRGMLKTTLVDQSVIAGIGNCYADEIAYVAGLRPDAKLAAFTEETFAKLQNAMHKALQDALQLGGYMEHPLFTEDKLTGSYNEHCKVYDRGGEPCHVCGSTIVQLELSSRKAFYCPECQPEL